MKLRKKKKDPKYYIKKAAVSAAGLVTAAAVLVSGLFSSPRDVVSAFPETPPAVIEVYETDAQPDEEQPAPFRRRSLKTRIRERLLSWPLWLRATLLLPFWGAGTAIAWLLRMILPVIVKWILGAVFPVLLLLLGLKILFPDIPLRKLLCRKNRMAILILSVLLFLTGPILEYFCPDKDWIVLAIKLAMLGSTFIIACAQIFMERRKAARKEIGDR